MFRLPSVAFLVGLTTGFQPAAAQTPTQPPAATQTPAARPPRPTPADPRSSYAWLCHGEGATRWRERSGEGGWELYSGPDA